MNKLFLIGNGFDLAHGLETSYSDFILWYLNKALQFTDVRKIPYVDELISLSPQNYHLIPRFESINEFIDSVNHGIISYNCNDVLIERLIRNIHNSNWVDIEYEYYRALLGIYSQTKQFGLEKAIGLAKQLNDCFEIIKTKLIEYLKTITISSRLYNDQIADRFKEEIKGVTNEKILFLIFNYTDTLKLYTDVTGSQCEFNFIHGQLAIEKNPIIFGYGDEWDENYQKIENLNRNEFLKNMKSFSYSKTVNYQNLNSFIGSNTYSVSIMGHSCGLSDRVLLSNIFCNDNCNQIKIYYYQKNVKENDFVEKVQEISRHFPPHLKHPMRTKIVPFPNSSPLIYLI